MGITMADFILIMSMSFSSPLAEFAIPANYFTKLAGGVWLA
jgi:hypothetical protein